MDLRNEIADLVTTQVLSSQRGEMLRKPLVGFASASDPLFTELKQIVGAHHVLPQDILPEAKTVVAFFVPFSREVIVSNRGSREVSPEWAQAYLSANGTINAVSSSLIDWLARKDIKAATVSATHSYDPETLTASWSHRSAAFIAGLGRFGLNRMLITPVGCAGRYGSVVISEALEPDPRPQEERCSFHNNGQCRFCVGNCPTKALTDAGIDRHKCNSHLLKIADRFAEWGMCDVCGKCVVGPCAILSSDA